MLENTTNQETQIETTSNIEVQTSDTQKVSNEIDNFLAILSTEIHQLSIDVGHGIVREVNFANSPREFDKLTNRIERIAKSRANNLKMIKLMERWQAKIARTLHTRNALENDFKKESDHVKYAKKTLDSLNKVDSVSAEMKLYNTIKSMFDTYAKQVRAWKTSAKAGIVTEEKCSNELDILKSSLEYDLNENLGIEYTYACQILGAKA